MEQVKSQFEEESVDIAQYHKCKGNLYWFGCYESDTYYKQYFEPSTYTHPAKISPLLAVRIFRHLEQLGLLKEGMTVLDFMAGSYRIPLLASLRGYKSIGIELEKHFTDMGEKNKKFAENKIGRKLDMKIIQGDSRQLSKILKSSDVGIVSPPFYNSNIQGKGNKLYLENSLKYRPNKLKHRNVEESAKFDGYSQDPKNIGNLKDNGFVGIISPPYNNLLGDTNNVETSWGRKNYNQYGNITQEGQIGKELNGNYLSAMLQVYKEASKVCPVICTITKNPTRQGKLRRLDLDTAKLLELSGYKIIDYHRAVLFKTYEQQTLTNSIKKVYKGRLSFFKRLSITRGNIASEWEDIIVGVNYDNQPNTANTK